LREADTINITGVVVYGVHCIITNNNLQEKNRRMISQVYRSDQRRFYENFISITYERVFNDLFSNKSLYE